MNRTASGPSLRSGMTQSERWAWSLFSGRKAQAFACAWGVQLFRGTFYSGEVPRTATLVPKQLEPCAIRKCSCLFRLSWAFRGWRLGRQFVARLSKGGVGTGDNS